MRFHFWHSFLLGTVGMINGGRSPVVGYKRA